MFEIAARIVEIQRLLLGANLSANARENLVAEQRRLWEAEYPDAGFEVISHDAWLSKRNLYL